MTKVPGPGENGPDARGPENGWPDGVPDAWRDFDDTLADGPPPADVPEEAKGWIAEQRLMHGLLRAMHTADAPAREGRIATLLERIDREGRRTPRRQWVRVLAAALVLACVGVWSVLPPSLPTAHAAVERAVKELARDVDRRFRIQVLGAANSGLQFLLVTRPGNRFRVDGKIALPLVQRMIEGRMGCDGQELWMIDASGMFRRAFPFAERERQRMPVLDGALDLGYLDVHNLLQKLTEEFDVSVVGRDKDEKGSRLRLEARRRGASGRPRWLRLQCDEATGMVTRIEIDGTTGTLRFEYLGEEEEPFVNYQRPW